MPANPDPYARIWADHRAAIRVGLATFLLLPLLAALFGVALGPFLDGPARWTADVFALVVGSVVWAVFVTLKTLSLRCPACDGPFQCPWRLRRRRCRACGLPFGFPGPVAESARVE
jgi:hypothetical protein